MPTKYWIQRINRVVNTVRINPEHDWCLDEVARVASASPYHFHRFFHGYLWRDCRVFRAADAVGASGLRDEGTAASRDYGRGGEP